MLLEWKALRDMGKLSSCLDGFLDTVGRDPSKVGTTELQVWRTSRNITFVNADFLDQTRDGSEHRSDGKLLMAMIDDEVDVIRDIARVVAGSSSVWVKVKSMKVKRCIKGEIGRGKNSLSVDEGSQTVSAAVRMT
jgi:hypothetical protein